MFLTSAQVVVAAGTQYQELDTTTPATGTLALGRYQSSLPTLTTGQMNEPMLDNSSRLIMGTSTATIGQVNIQDGNGTKINSTSQALNVSVQSGSIELTDGTNTANVVAGDSGFNGVATASATKTYTFTTSASGAQTDTSQHTL